MIDKAELMFLLVEMVSLQEQLGDLAERAARMLEGGDAEAIEGWIRNTGVVVPPMKVLATFCEEFDI